MEGSNSGLNSTESSSGLHNTAAGSGGDDAVWKQEAKLAFREQKPSLRDSGNVTDCDSYNGGPEATAADCTFKQQQQQSLLLVVPGDTAAATIRAGGYNKHIGVVKLVRAPAAATFSHKVTANGDGPRQMSSSRVGQRVVRLSDTDQIRDSEIGRDSPKGISAVRDSPKEEPAKRDSPKEAPVKRDSPKEAPVKRDSLKETPARRDSPKKTPVRRDSPKETPTKWDSLKEAPIRRDSPKESPTKRDSPKEAPIRRDSVKEVSAEERPVRRDSSKDVPVRQDSPKDVPVRRDSPKETPPVGRDRHKEVLVRHRDIPRYIRDSDCGIVVTDKKRRYEKSRDYDRDNDEIIRDITRRDRRDRAVIPLRNVRYDRDNSRYRPNMEDSSSKDNKTDVGLDSMISNNVIEAGDTMAACAAPQGCFKNKKPKDLEIQIKNTELTTSAAEKTVVFNIGGKRFETYESTLKKIAGSKLSQLRETDEEYRRELGEYFFDRNPKLFGFVLDYHRSGQLHIPASTCGPLVRAELDFWGINDNDIHLCCKPAYNEYAESFKREKALMEQFQVFVDPQLLKKAEVSLKYQLYLYLEFPNSSSLAQVWAVTFALLTILSIILIFMETIPSMRRPVVPPSFVTFKNGTNHAQQIFLGQTEPHFSLLATEYVLMGIFFLEYLFRLIMSPKIRLFFASWMNLIDLCIISAYWVSVIIFHFRGRFGENYSHIGIYSSMVVVRLLQVLRIFRIFKLVKQYRGLKVLILTLKKSAGELLLLCLVLGTFCLIYGALIFMTEIGEDSFKDIPTGMWWAVTTMTKIGYGDIVPTGTLGHIVGGICAITGVLLSALAVPVITVNFLQYYKQAQTLDSIRRKHNVGETKITMYSRKYTGPQQQQAPARQKNDDK
ncbi:uncharacterized protein LOC141898366 [Tubulanus polymorphus]|uniref:uncharacterized protein LOC141898366 n=1 Tax=Tubulanus polymorphus TaxID=672921 RepID=UPI003DA46F1D